MALLYMNGFEWNSAYENIFYQTGCIWQSTAGTYNPAARSGTYSLRLESSDWIVIKFAPTYEFYTQFAFNICSTLGYEREDWDVVIANFRTSASTSGLTVLGSISFNPSSLRMKAWSGFKGTLLGTSSHDIQLDRWYVFECFWKITNSNGRFESRLNGISDIVFDGDTQYHANDYNCTSIDFVPKSESHNNTTTGFYWNLDDIVVNDTTGSVNTSWPNGTRVVLLHPNGKGANSQWYKNPSTYIDTYSCVDGWPSMDPTEYAFTDQNAMIDTFTFPNLPTETNIVRAVRPDAWVQKNSGTSLMVQLAVIPPGGSIATSSSQNLGISYALHEQVWETNPHTTNAWTPAEVNAIEAGYKSIV